MNGGGDVLQVIDVDGHLPGPRGEFTGEQVPGPRGPDRLPPPPGYGFSHYGEIFADRDVPFPPEATRSFEEYADELVDLMDTASVRATVLLTATNDMAVAAVRRHPDRLIGFAHISPFDGMRGVRELERLIRVEGLVGLDVAALYDQVPASDARYYPLYAKCVELDAPVRIYTAMTYANDRPYDLGHPRHIDAVAIDFPELRMFADLSGWPWVADMVGLMRRHPNLYSTTGGHRARHFGTPGSGWEQFLQFGNTLLQDKVMVGLSAKTLNKSRELLIEEYMALPLKDSVKEKWLYRNAREFLRLS